VAPLAATLAATVAVGVGVALARAGRERRAAGGDTGASGLDREFALLAGERLGEGLRRIALGQVDLAIEMLGGAEGKPDEHAVHETRKALKRLRALLRLLRGELGETAFASENAALREIAARLAGARDSEVMLATLDALIARHRRKLARRGGVTRLRARLAAEHEAIERRTLGDEAALAEVLGRLHAFRARVVEWELADRGGSRLIEPGLTRIYGQGRSRYRRAARGKGDVARAMHAWRKRVKDLRYAAEMLQRRDRAADGALGAGSPTAAARRGGAKGSGRRSGKGARRRRREAAREAAWLRRLARRADGLGETLGEDHDLVVLATLIRDGGRTRPEQPKIPRRSRKLLLKLIGRRRRRLRERALRAGERLYRRSPKRFVRRVRSSYASGRRPLS
jgi:CHAD domain-containing protein